MFNNLKFTQLLVTKIFHDFAGPLSAMSSSVDYLSTGKLEMQNMAKNIINESSKKAINLLQAYRYLYGMLNAAGEADFEEMKKICINFLENKIQLNFNEKILQANKIYFSIIKSRIALGLIICAKGNLLYGGSIDLSIHGINDGNYIQIIASGNKIRIDENKIAILTDSNLNLDNVKPQNIHEFYVRSLLDESNTNLNIKTANNSIEYKFDL